MEEENTNEVPRKKRKVMDYEDGRSTQMDPYAEQYRTEILRLEDDMVTFFKCNSKNPYICSFTTKKKQSILTHIQGVHFGIKPYTCNRCSFACAYEAKLRGHQLKKHGVTHAQYDGIETSVDEEGEQVFHCPKCDYSARKIVSVKQHMPWHGKGINDVSGKYIREGDVGKACKSRIPRGLTDK